MKNKFPLLIVFIIFAGINIFAQSMNPPPPLIYSAPKSSEIKGFVSLDGAFKVDFPGTPNIEKTDAEDYSITSYKVYRKGSNSIVNVFEYKQSVEANTEEIIRRYKEGILNLPNTSYGTTYPKAKITEEKDIQIGNAKGKEFAYELQLQFYRARILFVKERMYEIKTGATNWHILTQFNKDKVSEFERETERFFNSFQLVSQKK